MDASSKDVSLIVAILALKDFDQFKPVFLSVMLSSSNDTEKRIKDLCKLVFLFDRDGGVASWSFVMMIRVPRGGGHKCSTKILCTKLQQEGYSGALNRLNIGNLEDTISG